MQICSIGVNFNLPVKEQALFSNRTGHTWRNCNSFWFLLKISNPFLFKFLPRFSSKLKFPASHAQPGALYTWVECTVKTLAASLGTLKQRRRT